jgi:hypothetical protein
LENIVRTEVEIPESGMELHDLLLNGAFQERKNDERDPNREADALRRMARVFAENPNVVLQELVDIAVEVCGADSAGVSLEERSEDGKLRYRWSAIAGSFVQDRRGTTSRVFTQSGAGFSGGGTQRYRGGLATEPISDGILIPWSKDSMRGRIWAVAYHSREAFHYDDQRLLTELADFATIAIRHRFHEQELRRRETDAAAATTANELAHQINNPLQRLTNTMYLARQGGEEAQSYLKQACHDLSALAELVGKLLEKAGDRA